MKPLLVGVLLAVHAGAIEVPSAAKPYTASSKLKSSKVSAYWAGNAFDLDQETAWVEGVPGDGVGEWIGLYLGTAEEMAGLSKVWVELHQGYQKGDRYADNGAPKRMRFEVYSGDRVVAVSTAPQYHISWELPLTSSVAASPVWLKGTVTEVRPGLKWGDTAISEIETRLLGPDPNGASAAAARFCEALKKGDEKTLSEFSDLPLAKLLPEFGNGDADEDGKPVPPCYDGAGIVTATEFDMGYADNWEPSPSNRFRYRNGRWRFIRHYILDGQAGWAEVSDWANGRTSEIEKDLAGQRFERQAPRKVK